MKINVITGLLGPDRRLRFPPWLPLPTRQRPKRLAKKEGRSKCHAVDKKKEASRSRKSAS